MKQTEMSLTAVNDIDFLEEWKMKLIVPDYYEDFACTAGACKHSCCIGWEIDIDRATLKFYRSVKGDFGERLRAGIVRQKGEACFRLGEGERCPFLNENGLCDIILNLGEEHLSQICTDHPRFCSFYGDRTEIGLGLCCEEAARLLLTRKEPIRLIVLQDDGKRHRLSEKEQNFFAKRKYIFQQVQNRDLDFITRLEYFIFDYTKYTYENALNLLRSLEIMDPKWEQLLAEAEIRPRYNIKKFDEFSIAFENLLWYFVYRYTSRLEYSMDENMDFVLFSVLMIRLLFTGMIAKGKGDMETLIELCRMYSCEIEYSEENVEKIYRTIKEVFYPLQFSR